MRVSGIFLFFSNRIRFLINFNFLNPPSLLSLSLSGAKYRLKMNSFSALFCMYTPTLYAYSHHRRTTTIKMDFDE